MQSPTDLRFLFLDLNAFFASVEQQDNPRLRGRPVAVVPIAGTDSTCAIAASYEAKRCGIGTGTRIFEARRLCPDLQVVNARHDRYVEYHHRVLAAVENHLPVHKVYSIDEMACRLIGDECEADNAVKLARRIKQTIATEVGECLRCSIGIAPSVLLAKTASDMQKPDGLVLLPRAALPGRLLGLTLTDLSGIGANMAARLNRANVHSVADLWALPPKHLRRIWNSVAGERFWYALHGYEIPEIQTRRRMIGHSRVLGGAYREAGAARLVARELVLKAGKRLRRYGLTAAALALSLRVAGGERGFAETSVPPTQDSFALLVALERLWRQALAGRGGRIVVKSVSAWLSALAPVTDRHGDLFAQGGTHAPAEPTSRERLWARVDAINRKYGRDTVALVSQRPIALAYLGAKIAFNRVPERIEFGE
jgi:DNA polymerase-4